MFTAKKGLLSKFILLLAALSLIILPACSDDDDNPLAPEEEHFEAVGIIFFSSGIQIAQILRGTATGELEAPVGGLSDHISVKFYDEDDNVIDPPENEEMSFSWEIEDETVVEVFQHEGEEGDFEFHLRGLKEGHSDIEFFVLHDDHADYRSGTIEVHVEDDSHAHGEPVGLKIVDEESGNVLATVNADGSVTGSLTLAAGTTTDHLEVKFFDEGGVEFQPEAPPHSLGITTANTSVVGITGQEAEEPWAFKLQGLSAGTTTITLSILHDGAVEETFAAINVTVN